MSKHSPALNIDWVKVPIGHPTYVTGLETWVDGDNHIRCDLMISSGIIYYYDEQENFHREDGPAWIIPKGQDKWFWHGKELSCQTQEEFEHLLKMKAFW